MDASGAVLANRGCVRAGVPVTGCLLDGEKQASPEGVACLGAEAPHHMLHAAGLLATHHAHAGVPCTGAAAVKPAAAGGVVALFRASRKERQRTEAYCRLVRELARGQSCWQRRAFLAVAEQLLARFSARWIKVKAQCCCNARMGPACLQGSHQYTAQPATHNTLPSPNHTARTYTCDQRTPTHAGVLL